MTGQLAPQVLRALSKKVVTQAVQWVFEVSHLRQDPSQAEHARTSVTVFGVPNYPVGHKHFPVSSVSPASQDVHVVAEVHSEQPTGHFLQIPSDL